MLEKYFKAEQELQKCLDKTYNPEKFEKNFTEFLESLTEKGVSKMGLPQFLIDSINDQLINFTAKLDKENSARYQRIIIKDLHNNELILLTTNDKLISISFENELTNNSVELTNFVQAGDWSQLLKVIFEAVREYNSQNAINPN